MAIGIVKTINGVKQIVPLTTDSGQGLPLGAWTSFEDDQPRNGYLKAGTTFNQSDYPALYNMLGSNVVPERFDHDRPSNYKSITISTSSGSPTTIQNDCILAINAIQTSDSYISVYINGSRIYFTGKDVAAGSGYDNGALLLKKGDKVYYNISAGTYGTSSASFYVAEFTHPMFIKAVIGSIEDSASDQVVQNINNSRSYSTSEVNTGKKWIDGKPIYRRVFYSATNWANGTVIGTISNLGMVTQIRDICPDTLSNTYMQNYGLDGTSTQYATVNISTGAITVHRSRGFANSLPSTVIVEYTKTTD